jgi:hypothetical protein
MNDSPRAVMMSIAEIAKRDGISKPGISRTVKRLVSDHGLTVERDAQGRVAAVNVAEYDHLREKFGNAFRAQAPAKTETPPLDAPPLAKAGDSLDEAQRQKAWIDAERSRMRLAEEKRELIRVSAVVDAVGACGMEIARIIDRLPNVADDLAAAIGRDGVHGVRVLLKSLAQKIRTDIAEALSAIAAAAPEFESNDQDAPIEANAPQQPL